MSANSKIEWTDAGGTDFQARLKRHVTLPAWRLEPEAGSSTAPWRPLAEEALKEPDQLLAQLDWLTTGEAESASGFGYELGKIDREFVFERPIADAVQRSGPDGNPGLIGGYLRGIHEVDPKRWLSVIEHLSEGPETKRLFPGVVMQSGLTDDAAVILVRLVRNKDMPPHYLQGFIFGGEIRNLSVTSFQSWIELLLHENDQRAVIVALQLLHHFFLRDQVSSQLSTLLEAVLLHEALFEQEGPETRGSHRDYDWSQLARMYLQDRPDRKLVIAKRMLEGMGKDSVVLPRFGHSYAHQLLLEIAKEAPHEVWAVTAPLLGPPIDSRAYSIQNWLRGGELSFGGGGEAESVLSYIPLQDVWDWVDQDVDHRAWYLAGFVPKDLVNHPSRPSVAREMLIRYGDRDDVQRNLIANYSTEGWMGPESEHYGSKKEELERLLGAEPELRVREWLNRYV